MLDYIVFNGMIKDGIVAGAIMLYKFPEFRVYCVDKKARPELIFN